MAAKTKMVALLVGGMGAERDVSLSTGKGFEKALEELKYNFQVIDAGADLPAKLQQLKPDVALLALHGKYAEDGTVQGICEYLKIPYSGSGVMSSAICMNKYYAKQIMRFHDLPTPRFEMVFTATQKLDDIHPKLGWPVVVKPSREGSTVGISIVKTADQLHGAIKLAAKYDSEILLEEFIPGTEITIPILDDRALTPIEIVPKQGFYDYKTKYTAGSSDYYLPPRLPAEVIKRCEDLAFRTHKALQCRSYSRVDFRLSLEHEPFILEVNTLPGCTPTSLLPKSAAHSGIPFAQVVKILVEKASLDYEGVR